MKCIKIRLWSNCPLSTHCPSLESDMLLQQPVQRRSTVKSMQRLKLCVAPGACLPHRFQRGATAQPANWSWNTPLESRQSLPTRAHPWLADLSPVSVASHGLIALFLGADWLHASTGVFSGHGIVLLNLG